MTILKLLPAIMVVFYLLGNAGFGVGVQVMLHYMGLVLAPLLFMYLSSHVFKFCSYHRLFIYYITIVELLNIVDWYFIIPFDTLIIDTLHNIVTSLLVLGMAIHFYLRKKLF